MAVNNQVLQKMVDQASQKSPKSGAGGKVVAVLLTAIIIGAGVWAYDNLMVIKVKDQALTESQNKVTELDNQNKNLAQQLNDLNKAKEEEEKLKARTIELADYNASVILPEEDTFSSIDGRFVIQDASFSSDNNLTVEVWTFDAAKKYEADCKLNGCDGDLAALKEFTEERDLWKNDKASIPSFPGRTYEIKTFNGVKYATLNTNAIGGEGYNRKYFTFLDDNTQLRIMILTPDQNSFQAIETFMSNFNLVTK